MSFSSALSLLVSLAAVLAYGYSLYYMNFNANFKKFHTFIQPKLRDWGQLKYLTYQCLLIQFLSSILHLGAHFSRSLVKPRDLVFTTLAYPVGSIVVYSFWAVWHLMGRELIFPAAISQFYPDWLNHFTHSIIVPVNILLALLVNHKYSKNAVLLTLVYFAFYTGLLFYIKADTGDFVYKYLDTMSDIERVVYFAGTGVFAYLMFKLGQFSTDLVHKSASQRPAGLVQKKAKQK